MHDRLWLVGGTTEGLSLARALVELNVPCIVSVATEAAIAAYPRSPHLDIRAGRLTGDRIDAFLQEWGIAAVLDASHPFATAISQLAIDAAAAHKIPYLRYERPRLESNRNGSVFSSFQDLLADDRLIGKRVLLAVGSRPLPWFQPLHDRAVLFARILPSREALDIAERAGFASDRLIALRPPVPAALERALWQHWQIETVVTKASGSAGGEDTKRRVATELGVESIAIARPPIVYPQQIGNLEGAIAFVRSIFSG